MKPDASPRQRPQGARRLDRALTRLMRLGGRLFGRPDERLLNRLTGRSRGGETFDDGGGVVALEAGRRALEAGQHGEALFHFSEAARRSPQDPWPLHGRGDALQLSGDPAAALEAYRAALALDPALALAHNGVGNALRALGRLEEAREAWRRALALDPSLPWPRASLEDGADAPGSDG